MSNNNSSKMTLVPVMITFFTMGFVDLVGAVSNNMQEDFGLSDSAANFFPSLVFFWFLIFSVPTGMLMNKIGRKKTVLLSIIVTTLAISLIVTILNMYEGFRATDAQKIRLMAAMGASRWQLLWMLVFPANYATLLNTLKVNVGLSWVGVIMGEFLVSRAGLGYLIVYGSQVFNMDLVMTSVLLLLVAAVVMYRLVLWVEKLLYRVWGLKA